MANRRRESIGAMGLRDFRKKNKGRESATSPHAEKLADVMPLVKRSLGSAAVSVARWRHYSSSPATTG